MNKRIVLIHGWADKPERGWLGATAKTLREEGFEVINPQMPREKIPKVHDWIDLAKESIGELNDQTVLVGHSLGTFTLLRFLSEYMGSEKAKALILVAGFLEPGREEAKLLFMPKPNTLKVQEHVDMIYHIYSDNDQMLSVEKSQELASKLGGEQIMLPGFKHFTADDLDEFPQLIDIVHKELS